MVTVTTKTRTDLDQELRVLLDEHDVQKTTPPADTRAANRLIVGLLALLLVGATIALMVLFVFDTTTESAYVGDWKDQITETTVEPYTVTGRTGSAGPPPTPTAVTGRTRSEADVGTARTQGAFREGGPRRRAPTTGTWTVHRE